jgi:hypothetical protein
MNYRLVHSDTDIIVVVEDIGNTGTIFTVFTGTLDACKAEAARMNLNDPNDAFAPFNEPK